jgi:hypothetical protein
MQTKHMQNKVFTYVFMKLRKQKSGTISAFDLEEMADTLSKRPSLNFSGTKRWFKVVSKQGILQILVAIGSSC